MVWFSYGPLDNQSRQATEQKKCDQTETWALFCGVPFKFTNTFQEGKGGDTNKNSDKITLKRTTASGVLGFS